MASAQLPDDPRDVDFEEYVAAVCQGAGLFVELNLIERDTVDLLQLDVLTTSYEELVPRLRIIEVKSGKNWGSTDIFKVRGAMHHINGALGGFVIREEKHGQAIYERLARDMGITFIHAPECEPKYFGSLVGERVVDERDVWGWRFCYWVQRKMIEDLRSWRKEAPKFELYNAILDYAFEITSGIFFTSTVAERVERLYAAFGVNRNIAARSAAEIENGVYSEAEGISNAMFQRTFYRCEYNPLHLATWIEHQSRLALLKAAVDYQSYLEAGETDRAHKVWRIKIGGQTYEGTLASFPTRFREALEEVSQEPHYRQYPLLWQWFLGVFGGFILLDYKDREYELLASKAGIPVDAVDAAFAAYNKLFPIAGGWLTEPGYRNIRLLRLYAGPIRGIGANYRRIVYTDDKKFESLKLTGVYTSSDLSDWNNMAVAVLTGK